MTQEVDSITDVVFMVTSTTQLSISSGKGPSKGVAVKGAALTATAYGDRRL